MTGDTSIGLVDWVAGKSVLATGEQRGDLLLVREVTVDSFECAVKKGFFSFLFSERCLLLWRLLSFERACGVGIATGDTYPTRSRS